MVTNSRWRQRFLFQMGRTSNDVELICVRQGQMWNKYECYMYTCSYVIVVGYRLIRSQSLIPLIALWRGFVIPRLAFWKRFALRVFTKGCYTILIFMFSDFCYRKICLGKVFDSHIIRRIWFKTCVNFPALECCHLHNSFSEGLFYYLGFFNHLQAVLDKTTL